MSDEAVKQQPTADIGIVSAIPIELAPLLKQMERVKHYRDGFVFRGGRLGEVRIANVETGLGFANARAATEQLITHHQPSWILACGLSGALVDGLKCGDIVVPTSLVDSHGNEVSVDMSVPEQPGLSTGRVLTAGKLIRMSEEKRKLGEQFSAKAVDTVSLAVAQVCRERSVRFLAARAISDEVSVDLPPEVERLVSSSGTAQLGAAASAIWNRPGSVKDVWGIREKAVTAAEKLTSFLEQLIPQLVPPAA